MSHCEEDDFDLIEEAYRYKVNGNYPQECTAYQKRSVRRKASQMILRDGRDFFDKKTQRKNFGLFYIRIQENRPPIKVIYYIWY